MEKESPITFTLAGIKTEEFATIAEAYDEKKTVEIDIQFDFAINTEVKGLLLIANIKFKSGKNVFIKLRAGCEFRFEPTSFDSFSTGPKEIIVPRKILIHLGVITVGTARGILHCKLEKSNFNQYILPTLDVNKVIEKDAKFSFEKLPE